MLFRLFVLEVLVYGFMASFVPFIFSLGLTRGYSEEMLSLAVALEMLGVMAGNVVWGRISDRKRTNRKTLIACCFFLMMFQAGTLASRSFVLFLACFFAAGFCYGAPGILIDSWVLRELRFDMDQYRTIRSGGAAGYAAGMLAGGRIVESVGFPAGLALSSGIALAAAAIAALTVESPFAVSNVSYAGKRQFKASHEYLVWLFLLVLGGLAVAPPNNMKIVLMERVGAEQSAQGMDGFLGCMAQAAMFLAGRYFRKCSPVIRMILVSLTVFAGISCYMTATTVYGVFAGSILISGIFSLVNPASREVVKQYVSQDSQTTAAGICDSCYSYASAMAAMMISGPVLARGGMDAVLSGCRLIALLTAVLCVFLAVPKRERKMNRAARK